MSGILQKEEPYNALFDVYKNYRNDQKDEWVDFVNSFNEKDAEMLKDM